MLSLHVFLWEVGCGKKKEKDRGGGGGGEAISGNQPPTSPPQKVVGWVAYMTEHAAAKYRLANCPATIPA